MIVSEDRKWKGALPGGLLGAGHLLFPELGAGYVGVSGLQKIIKL